MGFIDEIKARAKACKKTIVLPETEDERTYKAAEAVLKEGIADLVLVGSKEEIEKNKGTYDISGAAIVDPATDARTEGYIAKLVELRQKKGMTPEQAKELLLNNYLYYGVMMVKMGDADGMVSGACHSTADTLRPCLQILKTKPGTKLVSAFFVIVVPDCDMGADGTFVFADSGLEQNPDSVNDMRRMMDYYLPTTMKLLEAYEELDAQPVQGENIISSKKEIEDTIDTLNIAFEKLLDSLFQDTAWDVSSDISVLHTMLAQEGLTEDGLKK